MYFVFEIIFTFMFREGKSEIQGLKCDLNQGKASNILYLF